MDDELRGLPVKRVILKFQIAYIGWEIDNDAWLVEMNDGTKEVLVTSHGWSPYPQDHATLIEMLKERRKMLADLETAVREVIPEGGENG